MSNPRFPSHPDPESIELCLLNRADATAEQEVEEHLLLCDSCRILTAELEQEIELIHASLLQPLRLKRTPVR